MYFSEKLLSEHWFHGGLQQGVWDRDRRSDIGLVCLGAETSDTALACGVRFGTSSSTPIGRPTYGEVPTSCPLSLILLGKLGVWKAVRRTPGFREHREHPSVS